MTDLPDQSLAHLRAEMRNFEEMLEEIHPSSGEVPRLRGIDIAGVELPLIGGCGGDHIIYVDFDRMFDLDGRIERARRERPGVVGKLEQNRHLGGILIADAAGHRRTDALHVAMLHQAFLSCIPYELDAHGLITNGLFENLNTGFYNSVSTTRFITMIYGEISDEGRFRFISAGHPPPVIFSNLFDRIVAVSKDLTVSCPPLGMLPSSASMDGSKSASLLGFKKAYTTNQLDLLGEGDILLLYSDGLSEHGDDTFFPGELESIFRTAKLLPAEAICRLIRERVGAFAPQTDDISFVVIKRTV